MLFIDCMRVRGVACVHCAFVYWWLWLEGACCACASCVWCDMLVTAFARFWLSVVPCRHPRNAVNVQRVRCRPRVCAYVFVCVGVRFDAVVAKEYLVVVRVVWHAVY